MFFVAMVSFHEHTTRRHMYHQVLSNWAAMASYALSFLISTSCASIIVADSKMFSPSAAALALTYSYLIPYFLLHFVFIMNMIQVALTSLERVLQYSDESVSQEPAWHLPDSDPPPGTWPVDGSIRFENTELRYGRQHIKWCLSCFVTHCGPSWFFNFQACIVAVRAVLFHCQTSVCLALVSQAPTLMNAYTPSQVSA